MLRKFDLHLNKFPAIPPSLQDAAGRLRSPVEVELDDVFAHMYWDSYGVAPPTPNPFIDLYTSLITTDTYLRFRSDGLGDDSEIRRFESCRFGRALCRWLLHDHCGTPYFTSLSKVLKREIITGSSVVLERKDTGNAPDYICHSTENPSAFQSIYFAEAKGRYSPLKFDPGGPFDPWRQQVKNVQYRDTSTGRTHYSKGYVVATRLTNQIKPRTKSAIWAEDPNSSGETPFTPENSRGFVDIQRMIKACHYAPIMERLGLPEIATALRQNRTLPRDQRFEMLIYRNRSDSILDGEFVGRYILPNGIETSSPGARAIFVGLSLQIFRQIRQITFSGREATDGLYDIAREFNYPIGEDRNDGLTVMRDGTVFGLSSYFEPSRDVDDDLEFLGR